MILALAEDGQAGPGRPVAVAPLVVVVARLVLALGDLAVEAVPAVPELRLNSSPISSRRSPTIRKPRGRIATACSWTTTCS